jgi:hypothetical protein
VDIGVEKGQPGKGDVRRETFDFSDVKPQVGTNTLGEERHEGDFEG